MSILSDLFSGDTPEQLELSKRRIDIDVLQTEVAQKELDFVTLRAELQAFRIVYYKKVGGLYSERDELKAKIALLLASLDADKSSLIDDAIEAAEQAKATEQELNEQGDEWNDNGVESSFKPTSELKAAYRQAAKLMHPDRANDEKEQAYRNVMMAKANIAYESMDLDALVKLVLEFKAESEIGTGVGRELILLIRQESKLRERMIEIDGEIVGLCSDSLMLLRKKVEVAEQEGRNLLNELAIKLNSEIVNLKARKSVLESMANEADLERTSRVVNGLTPSATQGDLKAETGSHIHRTDRGDFVRSKSELIVANVFHALDMNYQYEMKITGRNTGGVILPDFVFITSNEELIVWEHLGMLGKPEYKKRWRAKQEWYENNDFVMGVNLFVSRDQSNGSIDSQILRKQALLVKTLL